MPLGVGLRHERQVLAWAGARKLECIPMNALDTRAREYGCLGRDFLGQPAVRAPAAPGIFAFGILADDDPVDLLPVA